jgi:hypothetical protein
MCSTHKTLCPVPSGPSNGHFDGNKNGLLRFLPAPSKSASCLFYVQHTSGDKFPTKRRHIRRVVIPAVKYQSVVCHEAWSYLSIPPVALGGQETFLRKVIFIVSLFIGRECRYITVFIVPSYIVLVKIAPCIESGRMLNRVFMLKQPSASSMVGLGDQSWLGSGSR